MTADQEWRERWPALVAAAQMVTNRNGRHKSACSIRDAVKATGFSREAIRRTRLLLAAGTPEEIEAIAAGRLSLDRWDTARRRGADPLSVDADAERAARRKLRGRVWIDLRGALESLAGMPAAADVLDIERAFDRGGVVAAKLEIALLWLMEFHDARHAQATAARNGDGNTGNGNDVAGSQQSQPPA